MAPQKIVRSGEDIGFVVEDWGLVDYSAAVERQLAAVDEVAEQGAERLIFCSHPPLVTVGRGTKPGDIFGWKGALLETARGGRATYHGPSQIVVYPILNLNVERAGFKARDIHGYMHALETAIVDTLQEIGISAKAGSELEREGEFEPLESGDAPRESDGGTENTPSLTGVWVGDKKIASVGIGVRKGISYHGLALNVENDPQAFRGINPCGFTTDKMTSVEKELGQKIDSEKIKTILKAELLRQFII